MKSACTRRVFGGLLIAAALLAAGCERLGLTGQADAKPQADAPPPPEVAVVTVQRGRVPLIRELPGRLQATRTAEVRARVEGIVLQRAYDEGSDVAAGTLLFRLDPAPYRAAVQRAEADLARAEANVAQARLTVERYRPLLPERAISRQEYDQAVFAQKQAEADVAGARAALEQARLELGYTTINAPIAGRAGRALVTEGALVGQNEATHVATVEQIDPIYAYFSQSSTELLELRRATAAGELAPAGEHADAHAPVRLLLEDGTEYPLPGALDFSDLASDPTTGAVTLRAEFPNPDRLLLPGMFVRVRLQRAVNQDAVLVPLRAVRMARDGQTVLTLTAEHKVELRRIRTARMAGDYWVVNEGLAGGEQIIVDGLQKAQPGSKVRPVPAEIPAQDGAQEGQAADAAAPAGPTVPDAAAPPGAHTRAPNRPAT